MTIHPDSLKRDTPASYYCSECRYRHNKGSIRYHEHWMWRTATPEVLKVRKHSQQGISLVDMMIAAACIGILIAVVQGVYKGKTALVKEEAKTVNYTPIGMYVWHDDPREVTCYVYINNGISCIPDTKRITWFLKNPEGVPPQ